MKDRVLKEIKNFAMQQLRNHYGYCGCAEGEDMAMINSDDGNGRDIEITIKIKDED